MKYLILLYSMVLFGSLDAQMINGGFEQGGGTDHPSITYSYNIGYALGWHNLNNSCDWYYDNTTGTSAVPHSGLGCGKFGWSSDGSIDEYCFGETQNLVAGNSYAISFWVRKDFSNSPDFQVGAYISATYPTPMVTYPNYIASVIPQVTVQVTNTTYKKVSFCFTATQSGKHYITFGSFKQNTIPAGKYALCYFDDVSIVSSTPSPIAVIAPVASTFCDETSIILDGTNSTNEDEYEWDIYDVANGVETQIYDGEITAGNASTLTISTISSVNLTPGHCYRAYLTVYKGCGTSTYVDFCIVNPQIDFIFDGSSVCENTPLNLQVTGENGWTYTWSDASGQLTSGTGAQFKQLTVAPTTTNNVFTVTVTTPEGCTYTKSITLHVSEQNNIAPWMDGINGWGIYTQYVKQGQAVNFTSTLYNDHPNEDILVLPNQNIPGSFTTTTPNNLNSMFTFSWQTSQSTPTGEYHYILTANDQNACQEGIGVFDFRIIVICDQCPICLDYENRTPASTPLPPETKAGQCIYAGLTQATETGDAEVIFQAGESITHGNFWQGGPGYQGIIEPTTCVTDCEDCCANWSGFTYDPLPNPFYMNFSDSDPTNDIIQVTDTYHPFCAFNAMAFDFYIENSWGNHINDLWPTSQWATSCCEFQSPAPENPISHSPIWWDGKTTNLFGNHVRVSDGVYFYTLTLYGCNGQTQEFQGYIEVFGTSGMRLADSASARVSAESRLANGQQAFVDSANARREALEKAVSIHPNPASEFIEINGADPVSGFYQLFDDKGLMLTKKEKILQNNVDISKLASGTYHIWIYSEGAYVSRKFVKI